MQFMLVKREPGIDGKLNKLFSMESKPNPSVSVRKPPPFTSWDTEREKPFISERWIEEEVYKQS